MTEVLSPFTDAKELKAFTASDEGATKDFT
jgi:hypothetical protein